MSEHINKRHNVSLLMYHIVCPAKYRRVVFWDYVDVVLKEVCLWISDRYEIMFLEIWTDKDHVHFLVQSVPMYSAKKIVQIVKSITAREIFSRCPDVKKQLRWAQFWTNWYYINTVSAYNSESEVMKYIQWQGNAKEYNMLHKVWYKQARLF